MLALGIFLFMGPMSGLAQTIPSGRYEFLTDSVWRYSWVGDSLQTYSSQQPTIGENGQRYLNGGRLRLDSLEWKNGGARLCLTGSHFWFDYGWTDFNACGTGRLGEGLFPRFSQPDFLTWFPTDMSKVLYLPLDCCDTAKVSFEARKDTVLLSLWWYSPRRVSRGDRFFPGNISRSEMRMVTAHWLRKQAVPIPTGETFSLNRHVFIMVPEGTVKLGRSEVVATRSAWLGSWLSRLGRRDLLGRRSGP